MCHDFGFRAATCLEESLNVSYQHLYCFGGTDTFAAAYNAYINGASSYDGISVDALAHRVVQGFVCEEDSYRKIYDSAENGDIISMVADCYNYKNAVEKYLLPLAKESIEKNNGKIVVCRPDSGDPLEDILWTIDLAEKNGLFEITRGFKYLTTLRLIHGDSMTFEKMITINNKLISMGWAPHGVLIYGVGGFLRNIINRDNLSAKYALYKVGNRNTVKFSNTPGKYTLPDVKVLRDPDSLSSGITIVDPDHYGTDSLVKYYSYGNRGKGLDDGFSQIKNRILNDFNIMPKHGGILDSKVQETIETIKREYVSNG
jgi:nicotinic acid phosphoribosyltransferase